MSENGYTKESVDAALTDLRRQLAERDAEIERRGTLIDQAEKDWRDAFITAFPELNGHLGLGAKTIVGFVVGMLGERDREIGELKQSIAKSFVSHCNELSRLRVIETAARAHLDTWSDEAYAVLKAALAVK